MYEKENRKFIHAETQLTSCDPVCDRSCIWNYFYIVVILVRQGLLQRNILLPHRLFWRWMWQIWINIFRVCGSFAYSPA